MNLTLADRLMISIEPHLSDEQVDAAYDKLKQVYAERHHADLPHPREVLDHLHEVGIQLKIDLTFKAVGSGERI